MDGLKCESKVKMVEESKVGALSLTRNTLGGLKGVLELQDGTRKNDKHLFIHTTTFPFTVYFVPLHEAHIQMAFCLETPIWYSYNFGVP